MPNKNTTNAPEMRIFTERSSHKAETAQHQEPLEIAKEMQHFKEQFDSVSPESIGVQSKIPVTVSEKLIDNCIEKFGADLAEYLNPEMSTEEIMLITTAFRLDKDNPARIPKQLPVESLREVVFGFANRLDFCDEAEIEDSSTIHKLVVICSDDKYKTVVPDIFTEDGSTLDYEKINKLFAQITE